MNDLINQAINGIIAFTNDLLMPVMILAWIGALVMRGLIHVTVLREEWFAKAFHKRAYEYLLKKKGKKHSSYYVTVKFLLEKTYYELFVMRSILKRRNPDIIMDRADRLFLVQQGSARLVKDTLKHVQFFRYDMHRPKTLEITTQIFEKNPQFNKALGIFPIGTWNDILNTVPGLFIVGGIFGTFLGIMTALPELGAMDLADIEKTKATMDHFLVKMSYSMITSILGILLNVSLTFINAIFNPSKIFTATVERYDNALDTLWAACSDNKLPSEIPDFDEHRDPIEALAEESIMKEINKMKPDEEEDMSEISGIRKTVENAHRSIKQNEKREDDEAA